MPRKIIPLITGETYHIFNRGVEKRPIFKDRRDFYRFYSSLHLFNSKEPIVSYRDIQHFKPVRAEFLVNIHAFSLLPNHYHLLITQRVDNGISEFIKRIAGGYTSYFNEKYERSGVLFQGKFKRIAVESNEQFQYLFAYVNENHYVHRVKRPEEIMYTSSLHYQGKILSKVIDEQENDTKYLLSQNIKLAEDIYERRKAEQLAYTLE